MPAITRVAVFVMAGMMLVGCGARPSTAHKRPHQVSPVNPTEACLQLHNWQLHNTGQGISAGFGRQLEQETRGTQIGTDIIQWLQDLGVNPNQIPGNSASSGPGPIESYLNQTVTDAAAVAQDCEGYGVRNTVG